MKDFKASNGYTISEDGLGYLWLRTAGGVNPLHPWDYLVEQDSEALAEFYQHQRDEELGRWLWPEDTNWVAYHRDLTAHGERATHVMNELSGRGVYLFEDERLNSNVFEDEAKVAKAYFEAHPKPWHDAKPGEVWVIRTKNVGDEVAVQVGPSGDTFQYNTGFTYPVGDLSIVSARRIWPEES